MEQLADNQTEVYDSLVKLLTNIKKDGAERKTADYCKRKLEILENYWREYQRNHRKCCELAEFDHVYFTKDCFTKAEEVYSAIKQLITKTMELLLSKQQQEGNQPLAEAGTSNQARDMTHSPQQQRSETRVPHEDSKLEGMIKKQTIHFRAFMRTVATIEIDQLQNKWEFDDALKSLQSRWTIIDSLHWEIEGENGDEDVWYQEEFARYEKMYNELKKTINSKMWSVSHRDKSTPQMDIPIFQGNYHQWTSFKDLFTETIHKNPSLSNAQKMQFLKSKVSGEAERLIHHLQISSENYGVCWELLNHRYGNNRLIFTSHVNILLNIPSMQQQSLGMIKKLHDVTKECLHAIQNLGVDITTWDPLLVLLLSQKLDSESFAEYIESVKNPRELPILQEFLDFLENKFTALEASRRKQESNNQRMTTQPQNHQNYQANQKKYYSSNNNQQATNKNYPHNIRTNTKSLHISRSITCALCNADHGLWMCTQFLQMSDEQKLKTVNQLNCCTNCLFDHLNKPCFSNKTCRKCNAKHNSLLHEAITTKTRPNTTAKSNHKTAHTLTTSCVTNDEQAATSTHVSWDDVSETLLATALVKVPGSDGTYHTMRALIDQGSQISLITEKAAQVLKLRRQHCKGTIFGVGEKENSCKGVVTIRIKSIHSDFALEGDALLMNSLIKSLPNKSFIKPSWPHIQNINLADPEFNTSRPVDLLLGADVYCKIALGGLLRGDSEDQPIAQQTQLGWLLCGTMTPQYRCNVVLHNTDDLRRFWENEDITQQNEMSTEDYECLQYFLSTTERLENGRYQVRLPFKPETKEQLRSTKPLALAQYRNLERKLQKDPELKTEYAKFMDEYSQLNHMIPSATSIKSECYLPHHCVTRAESTTTKLRVVFNASARSSSGLSLNDVMYRGPNLQQDLQELILKWRQYQFVYTADIEKMYRQIMVHPDEEVIQQQHKTINKHINALDKATIKLQQEIDVMTIQQDFTLVSIATINMMQNLKRMQDTLIDTISEIYHGQISLHLLTPAQLKRELQIIYGQMPQDLGLPINNIETDLQYIYKLLKTKARVTEEYIIFEITFPLIARESFQLYKIIPVPQQINYSMISIIPISEYVAVNLKRDAYFVPTIHELDTCLYHGKSFMCELFKPILNLEKDENFCEINPINQKCKTKTSACTNRWIELHSTSQYLYFCCDTYSIKIICDDQVTVRQLTRAGIISMTQKCFVKSKDFTLYSLQQQSNQLIFSPNMFVPELDQINHIVNLKIPTEAELPEGTGLNRSLSILGEQIKTLKSTKAEVDDISVHDIHQYTVVYILLGVVICAAAVWFWRRARCCCSLSAVSRAEPHHRRESVASTSKSTKNRVQSSADRQQSESEQIGLSSFLARRWPSGMRSAGNKERATLPVVRKERVFTVEDSLV